ncbi:CoA transferase [Myxococcota bacterium]|nr:CoA transferase [Myxococcota bacterium]
MSALEGLRVLDLTQYEAGTSCTQWLGWYGADVVKVERPGIGEPGRALSTGPGDSGYFVYWNSNKRSVAIDLTEPDGRDLLLRMASHFDVFVENYGPGVVERLGLDEARLRERNPEIIYARVKGFGGYGPYSQYKCYDMVAQAAGGAFSVTGEPDGPPMRPGPTLADSGSGLQLAFGILAAYVQRLREGKGQRVEVSMQEAATYFLRTTVGSMSDYGREVAPRTGNGVGPFSNLYPCSPGGANDYVFLLAATPRHVEALCRVIGRPDLAEETASMPQFGGGVGGEFYEVIKAWTSQRSKTEAMRLLAEAGVPCSAVLDTLDLFEDPHLRERGFVETLEHAELGPLRVLGAPVRLSESQVETRAAPLLGAHTAQVLSEELGIGGDELTQWAQRGVIGLG